MKPLYLKFRSEEEAQEALLSNGFEVDDDGNFSHKTCILQMVGTLPGVSSYNEEGDLIYQAPDLVGYHVNLLAPDDFNPPFSGNIINVKTPAFKWAGYWV